MLADIWTVCLREWQEILYQHNKIWKTLLNELFALAIFGIFFPLPLDSSGEDTSAGLTLWYMVPFVLLITKVPDSFAGERERHTLPTLLATRLSDRAIVLGKISAAVAYGSTAAVVASLFALIRVNVVDFKNAPIFFPLDSYLFGLGLSLLTATLIATFGILVSLRAKTVKQATQSLAFYSVAVGFIPLIVLLIASFLLPEAINENLVSVLNAMSSTTFALISLLCFAVFDLLLIVFTLKRFKRNQLILD